MRNRDEKGILCIPLAVSVFLFAVLANAQTRTNPSRSDGGRPTRVSVTGTVGDVLHHACSPALLATQKENTHSRYCATTDLVLATKDGFLKVRVGPTKFIRDNHFFFVNGDRLLVIGFLLPDRDRKTLVPEEVIKAKRDLTLRDLKGRPLWDRKPQSGSRVLPAISPVRKQADRPPLLGPPEPTTHATDLRFQKSEQEKQHAK